MTGHSVNTLDDLREGAREVASVISTNGSLAQEHNVEKARSEIKGLANRTGQVFSSASDEVYEALSALAGDNGDLLAQYANRFPVPSAGK